MPWTRDTELALNGTPIATFEGADFARAYFAIWLGEEADRPRAARRVAGGA